MNNETYRVTARPSHLIFNDTDGRHLAVPFEGHIFMIFPSEQMLKIFTGTQILGTFQLSVAELVNVQNKIDLLGMAYLG